MFRQLICNFRDPNLVNFYLSIYLNSIELKKTLYIFTHRANIANRKYEELCYPKNQKMCYPILVTLLKMGPQTTP